MKRRSVLRAYEPIRPDDGAKQRMLENILSSSEIPPTGKDKIMVRKNIRRIFLIAAIIAAFAGTVATATELLRIPVKETAAFESKDGTIEFSVILDEEVSGEAIPSVRVEPHFFTGGEIEHVAKVLFGDVDYYEAEPFELERFSKQEIQEKLDRWSRYANEESLYGLLSMKKDDVDADYVQEALTVVNKFITKYQGLYESASDENPHEPCRWTLRDAIEYMYLEEEWESHRSEHSNEEISVTLQYNGIPYTFSASQRNNEDFRVNNIYALIYDGISPYNIDEQIFRAELCRTEEPTEEQIQAVKEKAENWLSQMNMGSWMVDECFVETDGTGEYTEYYIHVNAVPVFNGVPAIRRDQITALRGREEGVTYYYYTDVNFEFSANGDLLLFRMYSPVNVIDSSYGAEPIPMDELIKQVKEELIESTNTNYSYIPTAYEGMCDVGCRITVTDVDYSLTRTTDVDDRTPFEYSLGISISGSVEYYDMETGAVLDYIDDRILLVLDAVDGSFVGRG